MITSQERIKAILNFQTLDRIAKADSFWEETVERWHREGLPENRSPGEHLGTDEISGIGVELSGQLEFKVIEETERYVILINENGVTRKALKGEDGRWSQHKDYADLDFTVKDQKSWEAYKERLQPSESRFSPKVYREVLMPSHKRLFDFCNAHDMPVIYHTDGDVRDAIPFLIEAGICCLQPLEAKAGLDVRELKAEYGDRLAFMGNIDIQVMGSGDRRLIEEEVKSKLLVAKRGGGYIYHSDHSVPPSVSLESYEWVMELIDRYGRY